MELAGLFEISGKNCSKQNGCQILFTPNSCPDSVANTRAQISKRRIMAHARVRVVKVTPQIRIARVEAAKATLLLLIVRYCSLARGIAP